MLFLIIKKLIRSNSQISLIMGKIFVLSLTNVTYNTNVSGIRHGRQEKVI